MKINQRCIAVLQTLAPLTAWQVAQILQHNERATAIALAHLRQADKVTTVRVSNIKRRHGRIAYKLVQS